MNARKPPYPTRVSRNGQVVLAARARRAVGIEPGDRVVSVPVAPGVLLIEKVGAARPSGLREAYEGENPLRGIWGDEPDRWLDDLRGRWQGRAPS